MGQDPGPEFGPLEALEVPRAGIYVGALDRRDSANSANSANSTTEACGVRDAKAKRGRLV